MRVSPIPGRVQAARAHRPALALAAPPLARLRAHACVAPRASRPSTPAATRSVAAAARRRPDDPFDWRSNSSGSSGSGGGGGGGGGRQWGGEGRPGRGEDLFSFYVNGQEVRVSQSLLWRSALPAAGLLAGAALLGLPLLLAASGALAFGAAVAAGGLAATALFLPFFLMAGLAATLSFGAFAAVFMVPQLIMLLGVAAVGGGLLLGFGGISALSALAVGAEVLGGPKRRGAAGAGAEAAEQEAEAAAAAREVAEAAREAERELRSFDEALRRRERQRQL